MQQLLLSQEGTFITCCWFRFPRQTRESANLLSVDECIKLSHRKMYNLSCSPEEIRINNYNSLLLMLWKANMDLQYIGESSLTTAQYVTGYVTKAEKSNMQDLWQEVSAHSSVYRQLWLFGIRCMRSRECGLYEASETTCVRSQQQSSGLTCHFSQQKEVTEESFQTCCDSGEKPRMCV